MKKISQAVLSSLENGSSNFKTGILKAQLSVLLLKNEITYQTPFRKIQQVLISRFNVEYNLSEIEEDLFCLHAETHYSDIEEQEEDYFDGF